MHLALASFYLFLPRPSQLVEDFRFASLTSGGNSVGLFVAAVGFVSCQCFLVALIPEA